ncbi:4-(cytidine 5'-diphospho)-2-C-methyl-D-erythritol kinase [Mailhella sp.]|uniref:4-(cytidine 5'-diphospho)-2-C-methyl-D-erythritol kinase n=1 Tax=Mailhella sp. TaxID=1981029 RepID=UPI004063FE1D
MREEIVRTGGKINLFLFITGRRENGYHELYSLFTRLPAPQDTLVFRPAERESGIRVACATSGIDLESNTLTKAYARYAAATGFAPAVDVELVKGIPHGAGLGGGSADGAEVLAWLQRQNPSPLPAQELNALAARVGADVPFFLAQGSCMAEGIGDELSPAETGLEGWYCVLVCPQIHVDTARAYAAWDAENPSFSLTEERKADKNNRSIYASFYGKNDFEAVVFAAYPVLAVLKSQLIQQGADIAGMSGSGSALFGLFRDRSSAALAVSVLESAEGSPAVYGPFKL